MTQDEGNSLGGRLGPLCPGRRSVGGLAVKLAGQRYLGWSSRPRQARVGAQGGAGRAEGAADEGRPAHRHHPRCPAAGVCQGARAAAGQCAGHGLDLRAPAHGDRAGAGLAGEVRHASTRRPRSRRRSARSIARRCSTARRCACKLQYPDMASAMEADLNQLKLVFAVGQRFDPAIRTDEIHAEITTRLREELDYRREARHVALYRHMLRDEPNVHVPEVVASHFDRPAADHDLAGRASRCSTGRAGPRRRRTSSPSTCSAPGTCRSMSTA